MRDGKVEPRGIFLVEGKGVCIRTQTFGNNKCADGFVVDVYHFCRINMKLAPEIINFLFGSEDTSYNT
jgi:hypothetical protein